MRRRTTHQFHALAQSLNNASLSAKQKAKKRLSNVSNDVSQRLSIFSSVTLLNIKDLAKRVQITIEDTKHQQLGRLQAKSQQKNQIASKNQTTKVSQTEQILTVNEPIQTMPPEKLRVYINDKPTTPAEWTTYLMQQQEEQTQADTLGDQQNENRANQVIIHEDQQNLLFLEGYSMYASQGQSDDFWDLLEGSCQQQDSKSDLSSEGYNQLSENILQELQKQIQDWHQESAEK